MVTRKQTEPKPNGRKQKGWKVICLCPTPLAHKTMVISAKDAKTQGEAMDRYCRANGISGSDHEFMVEEVTV